MDYVYCTTAMIDKWDQNLGIYILIVYGGGGSQFPSTRQPCEDEDFLKLYLPLGGDTIKEMAEHLEYSMPYKTSVYANVAGFSLRDFGLDPCLSRSFLEQEGQAPRAL